MPAISPKEASSLRTTVIPDFIFDAWNEVLLRNLHNASGRLFSRCALKDIEDAILTKLEEPVNQRCVIAPDGSKIKREDLKKLGFMDLSLEFKKQGWKVEWDGKWASSEYRDTVIFKAFDFD